MATGGRGGPIPSAPPPGGCSPSAGRPWSPWCGRRSARAPSAAPAPPWSWPERAAAWPGWLSPPSAGRRGREGGTVPVPPPSASPLTHALLAAAHDEEGLDVVLLEVGVALAAVARLHLVVPVQVLQRGPGDVDAPTGGGPGRREKKALSPAAIILDPPFPAPSRPARLTRLCPPPPCGWPGSRRWTRRRTATCAAPGPRSARARCGCPRAC